MTRTRILASVIGLFVASLMFLPVAEAQGPGGRGGFGGGGPGGQGGFGGRGSNYDLLYSPQVQKDLKLTDKQLTALDDVRKKADEQRQQLFAGMRGNRGNNRGGNGGGNAGGNNADPNGGAGGGGGAPPDFASMRENMTNLQQQIDGAYNKILSPTQVSRLGQIALQREGIFAVSRTDMAEKLNLGPDQIEEIQQINNQMRQNQRDARRGQPDPLAQFRTNNGGVDLEGLKTKLDSPEFNTQVAQANRSAQESDKVRQQATVAITNVLQPKQRSTFNKMLGEPFDTTKMTFNRGSYLGGSAAATVSTTSTGTGTVAAPKSVETAAAKPAAAAKKKGRLSDRRGD